MAENEDLILEQALRDRGILSPQQIEKARAVQKTFGGAWSFRDVLLARRLVTEDQLASLDDDDGQTLAEGPESVVAPGAADSDPGTLLLGDEVPEPAPVEDDVGDDDDTEATLISAEGIGGPEDETMVDEPQAAAGEATLVDEPQAADGEATLITGGETAGEEEGTLIGPEGLAGADEETLVSGASTPGAYPAADEDAETMVAGGPGSTTGESMDDAETMLHVKDSDEDAPTMVTGQDAPSDEDLDDAATMVQEKRISRADEALEDEVFFEICLELGIATREELEEALNKQEEARRKGSPHRIGAVLLEGGVLEADQVSQVLQTQQTRVLACPSCGARTSATGSTPGTICACTKCAADLTVPDGTTQVSQVDIKEYLEYRSRGSMAASSAEVGIESGAALQLIGSTIGGCRIIKKLGEGGMGAVYMGEHEALRRQSAIKILPGTYANNPTLVARFFREARAAGKVRHPNIVEVFNVGQDKGLHFIEMEYVKGQSVKDLMDEGQVDLDECLRIIKETATGLFAAHSANVIHRDIKPDNLMLREDSGTVKIADFGLARSVEGESMDLTKTGQIMGTPTYISPEQADAQKTDQRTDIYSLGATFYHMVTNEKPFTGESPMVILLKHINEEPTPPTVHNPSIPQSVAMIVDKMMAKRLDQRYQTLEEVIKDIDAFQNGATISYKIKKKKKLPLKKLAVGIAALFVATVVGFLQYVKYAESKISSEEREASKIYNEAEAIWNEGEGDLLAALDKVKESLLIFGDLDVANDLKNGLENEHTYRIEFAAGQKAYGRDWPAAVQAFERAKAAVDKEEVAEKLAIARYEQEMSLGRSAEGDRRWTNAIEYFNKAADIAPDDSKRYLAVAERKTAETRLRNATFEKHLADADVALSKGDMTGAEKGMVEAGKLIPGDTRVDALEARIKERNKTIRFEREFRDNFDKGKTNQGNEVWQAAINYFEEAKSILEATPALKKQLAEDEADLEKRLQACGFGLRAAGGKQAALGEDLWEAIRLYKEAIPYGTAPERSIAKDAIYKHAMAIARPAWAKRDIDTAERAVDEALTAKSGDPKATALRKEVRRFSIRPEGMVYIPGGEFTAGTDHLTEKRLNPIRKATVAPFYMDIHEVTNRDFDEFVTAGGYKKKIYWDEEGWALRDRLRMKDKKGYGPRSWAGDEDKYGGSRYNDYPVVGLSWYEARAYAKWAKKRLPTDDEWEFAAGFDPVTKTKRLFPWGDQWDPQLGNFRSMKVPVPIFSFKETDKSPWGCCNMGGNASEWTNTAKGEAGLRGGSLKTGTLPGKAHITNVKRPVARARPPDAGFRCARDAR